MAAFLRSMDRHRLAVESLEKRQMFAPVFDHALVDAMRTHFGRTVDSFSQGDFDADSQVTLDDFGVLKEHLMLPTSTTDSGLWNQTIEPYLADALWESRDSYDAGHSLMIPMQSAFDGARLSWQRHFSDFFRRFQIANGFDLIKEQGELNELQFEYLISRFVTLCATHDAEDLIPVGLVDGLVERVRARWLEEPAWQWQREPFTGISERLEYKLAATNPQYSYHRAIIDTENFIIAIGAELRAYYRLTSTIDQSPAFVDEMLNMAERVYADRVVPQSGFGWLFQPGVWSEHRDFAYAGNETLLGGVLRIEAGSSGVFTLRNAGRWELDVGTHTVRLSMRESGAAIDALQVIQLAPPVPIVGLTEIQAESFARRQSGSDHQWWLVDQEFPGAGSFSGATGPAQDFLQSLNMVGQDTLVGTAAPGTSTVEYDIQVSTAGVYEFKLRVAGTGPSSDSLWLEVPTGTLLDPQGNQLGDLKPMPIEDVAEDSSHTHRMPMWLTSLRDAFPFDSPQRTMFNGLIGGLEAQFMGRVVSYPTDASAGYRTANYMDGRNGVYRYHFTTQPDSGYGPFELSGTLADGWWAMLGSQRVTDMYDYIDSSFPLEDDLLASYVGPNTTRDRNQFVMWPAFFENGMAEMICRCATAVSRLRHGA